MQKFLHAIFSDIFTVEQHGHKALVSSGIAAHSAMVITIRYHAVIDGDVDIVSVIDHDRHNTPLHDGRTDSVRDTSEKK